MPIRVQNGQTGPRNARIRRPVSCLPCRNRKLRCDRDEPACGNCVNRGDITSCCYFSRKSESRPKPAQYEQQSGQPGTDGGQAQARIDHLEQLVLTLMKETRSKQSHMQTPSTSADADHDERLEDATVDHEGQSDTSGLSEKQHTNNIHAGSGTAININSDYKERLSVDEAQWGLLLNEIGEVRSHLHAQHRQYEEQNLMINQLFQRSSDDPGPTLLFGSARNMSRAEILSDLPSRYCCDIMVTRFFAHLYPALHILHKAYFLRQYERFWNDESTAPTAWVAILFAILRIAMLDYLREGDEPQEFRGKCRDFANTFRNRLTDCLILTDYTRPQDFLIEALGLHIYGEYVSERDAKSSVWVLGGMVARLAMRMGYHQQSQPGLTSTPFQAEMRRRNWAYIRQLDISISFQLGLPSLIGLPLLDGPFPRNIYDDASFDEDCTTLPPSLPDSTPTQVSYLIAKTKLVFGFMRLREEISRAEPMKWERLLELDRELRQIYNNVPEYYKVGPLSGQDSLVVVSARFVLSSIHLKSLCVLHSRFLEVTHSDARFLYSRRVCLSSAMSILRYQAIQNQNIPVDGRMRSLTNYQTSLAIHEYLLAATIITADLCSGRPVETTAGQRAIPGVPTRAEMVKALSLSARIHASMRDRSVEAYKAADILDTLVRKFENETPGMIPLRHLNNVTPSGIPKDATVDACVSPRRGTRPNTPPCFPATASNASLSSPGLNESTTTTNSTRLLRQPQNMPRTPLHASASPYHINGTVASGRAVELSDPASSSSFDDLLSWFDHQQTFANYDPSSNWMMPDLSGATDDTSDGCPISTTTTDTSMTNYPTNLALHDPMSTLWNFSLP